MSQSTKYMMQFLPYVLGIITVLVLLYLFFNSTKQLSDSEVKEKLDKVINEIAMKYQPQFATISSHYTTINHQLSELTRHNQLIHSDTWKKISTIIEDYKKLINDRRKVSAQREDELRINIDKISRHSVNMRNDYQMWLQHECGLLNKQEMFEREFIEHLTQVIAFLQKHEQLLTMHEGLVRLDDKDLDNQWHELLIAMNKTLENLNGVLLRARARE